MIGNILKLLMLMLKPSDVVGQPSLGATGAWDSNPQLLTL